MLELCLYGIRETDRTDQMNCVLNRRGTGEKKTENKTAKDLKRSSNLYLDAWQTHLWLISYCYQLFQLFYRWKIKRLCHAREAYCLAVAEVEV